MLKIVGAAYVVWLGIQAIRHRATPGWRWRRSPTTRRRWRGPRSARSLRVGFTVGITNPKTMVFFVAFLPQFVNEPAGHTGFQLAALGLVFGAMAVVSDSTWALAASRARDWFARRPTRLDNLSVAGGVMMIGLGAAIAASE